jgi:spermidine synthase
MTEGFLKNFSIDIQNKLYEKNTPDGLVEVYETAYFGKILTINGQIHLSEQDGFFYHEMMTHPAIFTHPLPKKLAIIGNTFGILTEVLKHERIQEIACIDNHSHLMEAINLHFSSPHKEDTRIKSQAIDAATWLSKCNDEAYDIIIHTEPAEDNFPEIRRVLTSNGIFVQPHAISLQQPDKLIALYEKIQQSGFASWQLLNFSQPSYPSGWRVLSMATKHSVFKRVREIEVFNRSFTTRYYNFDVHKAALALPEFANYLFNPDTL